MWLHTSSSVWGVCTFPRQLRSERLTRRSSGLCKGNFVLIVKTNTVQPALCSLQRAQRQLAPFCCQTEEGREEKNPVNLYQWRKRGHLVLLIVTEPWQWTERSLYEPPFISPTLPYTPQPPTSLHPKHLMKYVQGKQRWGWCADLPSLGLTTTRPVTLLIYKACRVSARVASLASLHAIRALS